MIGKSVAWCVSTVRDSWARAAVWMGLTPNSLTILGTLLTIMAGACFALGVKTGLNRYFLIGAGLLCFSIGCDMIDGIVARLTGKATQFGAMLDSTMDRVSDFAIWAGLAFGFAWQEPANLTFIVLCLLGWLEASMISYVKARSEDFIDSCKVGYWQRGERSAATIISAFACNPAAYVVEQGILPMFTLLRRIFHARAVMAGRKPITNARIEGRWYHKIQPWLYPRMSWPYDLMTAAYIAFLVFFRIDPARWDVIRFWLD